MSSTTHHTDGIASHPATLHEDRRSGRAVEGCERRVHFAALVTTATAWLDPEANAAVAFVLTGREALLQEGLFGVAGILE